MTDVLKKLELAASGRGNGNPFKGNKTLELISSAVWLIQEGKDLYDKAHEAHKRKTTWTVTVDETDSIFRKVQAWLISVTPNLEHKNVTANTQTYYVDNSGNEIKGDVYDIFGDSAGARGTQKARINISLRSGYSQNVNIDGHKVIVRVSDPIDNEPQDGTTRGWRGGKKNGNINITFTCRSLEAQHAVVELLDSMVVNEGTRVPALWVADSWGQWRSADAPARKLSSVVLAEGVKEDLMEDLRKFLSEEKKYTDLGIPWHRGYLLYGPPGSGKTSMLKAMATELGLDLWYAPVGDLKEDSSLVDLVRSVKARGILLLEDVDTYAAAQDREGSGGSDGGPEGLSTAAILNVLDGVVTPHGLITVMTTNHIEKLDPALLRSGRADRVIELGYPSWDEVCRLWALFFPHEECLEPSAHTSFADLNISQARISEVLKRHWDEPEKARSELMELINE